MRWLLLLLASLTLRAENWPAWRGPRGDGSSHEKNIPVKSCATENVASPAISNGQIFLRSDKDLFAIGK